MALTIRADQHQQEVIEKLKRVFDQKTASGALILAASDYLVLRQSFMELSKAYKELRDERNELLDLVQQRATVCNRIDEISAGCRHEYDGELPAGNDQVLGFCSRENLAGKGRTWN